MNRHKVPVPVIIPHSRDLPENPMDAPVCRTCGKKHWSRLCAGSVTDPVTQAVTPEPVTSQGPGNATPRIMEIEALRAEVVMLKRQLADAGTKATACPECERRRQQTAERVRKHRKQSPA